jgi:hypothetical protein
MFSESTKQVFNAVELGLYCLERPSDRVSACQELYNVRSSPHTICTVKTPVERMDVLNRARVRYNTAVASVQPRDVKHTVPVLACPCNSSHRRAPVAECPCLPFLVVSGLPLSWM